MKTRIILATLCIALLLAGGRTAAAQTETPAQRDARMQWWREARFGMFVHWGLYSGAGRDLGRKARRHQRRHGVDSATGQGRHRDLRGEGHPAVPAQAGIRPRMGPAGQRGGLQLRRLHHQAPRRLRPARFQGQRLRRGLGAASRPGQGDRRRPPRRGPAGRLLSLGDRLAPRSVRVRALQTTAPSACSASPTPTASGITQKYLAVSSRRGERTGVQLRSRGHPLVGLQRRRTSRGRRRGGRSI